MKKLIAITLLLMALGGVGYADYYGGGTGAGGPAAVSNVKTYMGGYENPVTASGNAAACDFSLGVHLLRDDADRGHGVDADSQQPGKRAGVPDRFQAERGSERTDPDIQPRGDMEGRQRPDDHGQREQARFCDVLLQRGGFGILLRYRSEFLGGGG